MISRFCVFGGAIIDRVGTIDTPFLMGQSHPGGWKQSVGGVGANVARHLANFGGNVRFATVFGNDDDAISIERKLEAEGLTLLPDSAIQHGQTPSYTVIHDHAGDVIVGLADMALHAHMNRDWVTRAAEFGSSADVWIADTNMPADTLSELCKIKGEIPLIVIAVSPAKIGILQKLMDKIDGLICNTSEAETLVQKPLRSAAEAASGLAFLGVPLAIVSNGSEPCAIARKQQEAPLEITEQTTMEANTLEANSHTTQMHLTGVGDTFAAACVFAHANQAHEDKLMLLHANAAAFLAMKQADTCPKINWQMIEDCVSQSEIQ